VTRRLVPALVGLGLGLGGLAWGLSALHGIFEAERTEAHAAVDAERDALAGYAQRALAHQLRRSHDEARPRREAALEDPLAPDTGLLDVFGGVRRLPRAVTAARESQGEGFLVAQALLRNKAVPDEHEGGPWTERVAICRRFLGALERRDAVLQAAVFRELLTHRQRWVLPAWQDLGSLVAVLDRFVTVGRPDPALMRHVLRGGSSAGSEPGLQRKLLLERRSLTARDLRGLSELVTVISATARVRSDDFVARIAAPSADDLPKLPESLDRPALLDGWYVEPIERGHVEGVAVRIDGLLGTVAREMRDRGLLEATDSILHTDGMSVEVTSPRWPRRRTAADRRYYVKTALLVACGALAAALVALTVALRRKEQRFVALKQQFVAAVSHELKTPLASVRLLAETLERRLAHEPRAKDYPTRIVRDVDGVSFLVDNVLSFNRLEGGRVVPRRKQVRIGDLLEVIREELPQFTRRAVRLEARGVEELVVAADPDLLRLLLANLVRNGCQHNERDPVCIHIDGEAGPPVRLRVRDNGVGIPTGEQRRVFGDFYRPAGSTRSRGSGLGLAICRRVVEAHGGRIRVADSGPDGTTFEVTLR